MEARDVPGVSVAVFDDYGILWTAGYGKTVAGGEMDVTPETLFQAASISKPITALATLRLVEQGQLSLDDQVNDRLKSWQIPENAVTQKDPDHDLRHLLSHSAGLNVHGFLGYAKSEPAADAA